MDRLLNKTDKMNCFVESHHDQGIIITILQAIIITTADHALNIIMPSILRFLWHNVKIIINNIVDNNNNNDHTNNIDNDINDYYDLKWMNCTHGERTMVVLH